VRALLALPSLDIAACDNQGNNAVVLARRNGRTELADEIQELVRVLGHASRCPRTLSTNTPPPTCGPCVFGLVPALPCQGSVRCSSFACGDLLLALRTNSPSPHPRACLLSPVLLHDS
jgi:hypothetical protein